MRTVLPDTLPPPRTGIAAEHRDLESELFEIAHRLGDDRLADAELTFVALRSRLVDHMAIEEETLFSILAASAGEATVAILRGEHAAIRDLLGEMAAALAKSDREQALATLGRLAARVGEHSDREDALLYPVVRSATRASEG